MAGFIERNKKKGLLALLLYIARRGKTAAGVAMALVVAGLVLFLGTPEAVRQRVPWAPRGLLTRGMDASNSGLGADERDVAMRLAEEREDGMESLTRRMLNTISGPRQPVVDMVAARNADLQEPSAQKQLGDKLSKHGKGIRGIVRKEDSSRGSASIALSPQELQRGLANGPDQITQPQSSMRRNTPGGAPIGGGSSPDFSGQAQIGRQGEAGTPSEAGGPPEVGGPPPDTTSLITGGGEPIPEARAGDANFDLMAGTYGGGSSGGNAEMGSDPCTGNRRAQGCVQWKTEKDKSTRGGEDVDLKGYATDIYTQARLQLAEVKAYSYAAAPPGNPDGVEGDVMVVRNKKWTVEPQKGQCPKSSCPKEYASVVADAPFQKNQPKGGLVHVDNDVDLTQTDPSKVGDYAERIKEMDDVAKDCEKAALGEDGAGYGLRSDKSLTGKDTSGEDKLNLQNKLMKASDDYLKEMAARTQNREFAAFWYADLANFSECGKSKKNDWLAKARDLDSIRIVKEGLDASCEKTKCGSGLGASTPCCGHSAIHSAMVIAQDRDQRLDKDFERCDDHAGRIEKACDALNKAIANKRKNRAGCESISDKFTMADATEAEPEHCKNLVWNKGAGEGELWQIVAQDPNTLGRDGNFALEERNAEGRLKEK